MNTADQHDKNSRPSLINVIGTGWFNFRRKRFWLLFALLLYTLLGFLVAPVLIKNSVIDLLQNDLNRTASLGKVEVNPFALSLKLSNFSLDDKDDVSLATFSELYVNFQLSSLLNRAWTFSEVSLIAPYFFIERFDETDSRLSRIIADFNDSRPAEEDVVQEEDAEKGMTRLLIHDLQLSEGRVDLKDNVPAVAVETRLAPINISIQSLNTLPDRDGKQAVTIQLPEGASLKWAGSLTLAPLDSQGELVLDKLQLAPVLPYVQSVLSLESMSAAVSASLQYDVHMEIGGLPEVDVSDISVNIENVAVSGLTPSTEFLTIQNISLSGGTLGYPEQTLQFSQVDIVQPHLIAWLDETGSPGLAGLIAGDSNSTELRTTADSELAWQFGIDKFRLENGLLNLSDQSVQPAASVDVTRLELLLENVRFEDGTSMPMSLAGDLEQGGSFKLNGLIKMDSGKMDSGKMDSGKMDSGKMDSGFSVSTRLSTVDVPLALGQPYLQQFAHILVKNGVLNSEMDISLSNDMSVAVTGSVRVPALEIDDTVNGQKLLGWQMLDIDRFDFNMKNNSLNFSQMTLEKSFSRLTIHEDKTTNLSAIIIEQTGDKPESATAPMDIIIGRILVNDGEMDFSDQSLPLLFSTHIANLDGSISTIDTGSEAPANINLEGQVDEFGFARINGGINMFDPVRFTDVKVEFRNLLMSNLSPYTVQFAGREIDEGKLDLDLGYKIKEGLLDGNNKVVLSDLVLGQKVDHPGAASLPLGLAVGLLKDADGVIKIDLPVKGDINNPEFGIGGVVWKAISGLITNIVSAPFRLLGKLIGIDSEDLGQFEFLAGRADLTPPELEKVAQLEEALQQRPELVIEISGVSDPGIDRAALKRIRLVGIVRTRLGEAFGTNDAKSMMLDDEIRAVVEQMYTERFPDNDLELLKAEYTAPPVSDPEGAAVLDELAYATELWNQQLAAEAVSEQDLNELALARARSIRDAFLANGKFGEDRIVIAESKSVESGNEEWVILELTVASN